MQRSSLTLGEFSADKSHKSDERINAATTQRNLAKRLTALRFLPWNYLPPFR